MLASGTGKLKIARLLGVGVSTVQRLAAAQQPTTAEGGV
jgi:hypothetical protein